MGEVLRIDAAVDLHWDNATGDWRLHKPIKAAWQNGGTAFHFEVPAGFHTDLSSIPRVFRSIIPQVGRQNRASILHDWAYEDGVPGMKRAQADRMFLDVMKFDGVGWLRRKIMYAAVRAFGSTLWGKGDKS